MLEIDGSVGESGGQILRTAIALAAVTQQPCRIFNIRKGRPQPGLKHQHLEAIKAVQKLCNADVKGLEIGSTEIEFHPDKIEAGEIEVSIPTAGSIGLVLQAMMVPAIHAASPVTIKFNGGATNGKFAPPLNYIKFVLLPLLEKMGYRGEIETARYGYYPKGGALAEARIEPAKLRPLNLTGRGQFLQIKGISHASSSLKKARVAERQADACAAELKGRGFDAQIEIAYSDAACPGSGIELFAVFENTVIGADALGERNVRAEEVGKKAAFSLAENLDSSAAMDEHTEDQLLPYMALAAPSRIKAPKITSHTTTNIWAIEKFLPVKFSVAGNVISVNAL